MTLCVHLIRVIFQTGVQLKSYCSYRETHIVQRVPGGYRIFQENRTRSYLRNHETLLVLLSESAWCDGRAALNAGLAEIQVRDVTMVTALFGESMKLLPPTMYLGPISRAGHLESSQSSLLLLTRLAPRYVKTHWQIQGARTDLSRDRILFFSVFERPLCSIVQRSFRGRKSEWERVMRNSSER